MQFFTGISRNTKSKSFMLSLTACVWDFQNNGLWDTHNMPHWIDIKNCEMTVAPIKLLGDIDCHTNQVMQQTT